jgi:hypothetical protein
MVHLVCLNRLALQLHVGFGKQLANLMEDAPCGFVCDAGFALNLLRGDSAASRAHEIHGIEPSLERSGSFFENGPSQWVNLSPAVVAAIGGPAHNPMVFAFLAALLALCNPAGPTLLFHVLQAGVIVRKLAVKVPQGVAQLFGYALFDFHA